MSRSFVLSVLLFVALVFIFDSLDIENAAVLSLYPRGLAVDEMSTSNQSKVCLTPELDGEWVVDTTMRVPIVETSFFEPYRQNCPNFTDTYRWETKALTKEWDPNHFCQILGKRKIAVIGDSTLLQSARVLQGMLSGTTCKDQVRHHYADTLIFEPMGGLNRGAYWTDWVKDQDPDIVIVSAGAHIMNLANFTRSFQSAMEDIEKMKKEKPDRIFIWKTQNPAGGHHRQPGPNTFLPGHPVEAARKRSSDVLRQLWNHHLFWNWDNDVVLPELRKRGIPFVDMRMLYNRVDAHPWRTGDCLHFCLPGPLRLFPRLLQRLLENNLEVSKCVKML